MKTLRRLIRYHQKKIDEQRLFMAQVAEKENQLQKELDQIALTLQSESHFSSRNNALLLVYGHTAYIQGLQSQKKKVERYLKEVSLRLEQENEKIRTQFSELKKYEILYEGEQASRQKAMDQKEQNMQDDLNLMRMHSKKRVM